MARRSSQDPPVLHFALLAGALLVLLIGGTATFSDWGTVPVRLTAAYALGAILLHAASRYVPGWGGLAVRGSAWALLAGGAVHTGVLVRVEVLGPIAAVGLFDLFLHRTQVARQVVEVSGLARIVAGVATLVAIPLIGALVLLAQDSQVLARLGTVVLLAWALVVLFALRPETRDTRILLGGAGAFSLTFLLLAAPILPFGPLLAYWTAVASVALAVLAGTTTHTRDPLDPAKRRHAQRVHALPDPVIAPLRETVRQYLSTGVGARGLSSRIEAAQGREHQGRLLAQLAEARAKGTRPSRADRIRALAELLDVDDLPEDTEGTA